jgi:glycosyl transferase family 25
MNHIEEYFDKIFCINLDRRPDRWDICLAEFAKHNWTKFERFTAIDDPENGNRGCTASHKILMDLIVENGWKKTLVLEDDFKIVAPNFHKQFNSMIKLVPEDWEMLYLGGHYAEPPISRVNKHVIKHGRMFTTSSYGVTCEMAKKLSDQIALHGEKPIGPIDTVYGQLHPTHKCYIFQPRLMVQREGFSDLTLQVNNNEHCMMDRNHENMV